MNTVLKFTLNATLFLAVAFSIHYFSLRYFRVENSFKLLAFAYSINLLIGVFIVALLYKLRVKFKDNLGFMFLVGSFIKFAIFFLVFHPEYNKDANITTTEFIAFFAPYAIILILETQWLSKLLNKQD